jgi:bifunctional DNA-binding transcriptional regulator/antitoxin component of YhaV-PrlF toxin-antitoxin module
LDHQTDAKEADESLRTGFSVVDNKGRIALAKAVREMLGIEPGSSVAYVALDRAVLLVPQDMYLATLQQQAEQALATAGITVQDLLDALPQARDETVAEAHSPEFLEEMQRLWSETHPEQETE